MAESIIDETWILIKRAKITILPNIYNPKGGFTAKCAQHSWIANRLSANGIKKVSLKHVEDEHWVI